MTDTEYSCPMLQRADPNDDGDLIYERDMQGPEGTTITQEINCTHLYTPGIRKTGNIEILLIEARMAANGKELGNPAFPVSPEVADAVVARLEDGVEPGWVACTPGEFP